MTDETIEATKNVDDIYIEAIAKTVLRETRLQVKNVALEQTLAAGRKMGTKNSFYSGKVSHIARDCRFKRMV